MRRSFYQNRIFLRPDSPAHGDPLLVDDPNSDAIPQALGKLASGDGMGRIVVRIAAG
jgi:hypothetical protein